MSFADGERPKGEQLLGCCIVHAQDEIEAMRVAWIRGINPGGEIRFMAIVEELAAKLSFALEPFEWRLLAPNEARALADRVAAELAS